MRGLYILKCGDRFKVGEIEGEIVYMETANNAVTGVTIAWEIDGETIRGDVKLPYGLARTV